jgi:hypothetical protein
VTDPNKYADEGTIAHALAAMCLQQGRPASAYIGRVIRAEDYEHAQLSASTAHRWMRCAGSHALESRVPFKPRVFNMQVDAEMAVAVQVYLDNLKKYGGPTDDRLVEHKVPIGHITGEKATGTGDVVLLCFDIAEIQAHDFKYGQGVEVDAEENEQLAMYLCGALDVFDEFAPPGGWQLFRGVIHQPRIKAEPDEHVWTRAELMEFKSKAKIAAELAVAHAEDDVGTLNSAGLLVAGDKQCKFCSAKIITVGGKTIECPALAKLALEIVTAEFVDLDAQPVALPKPAQAIPADMERLGALYKQIPLAKAFFAAVAGEMEARLLAGEKHPDFKVVAGRKGNRAWRDEPAVEEMLKTTRRVKHDQMYDYKVISPTSAEKLVKSKVIGDRQWKKLQEMITQADGQPTVAPASDKRPALTLKPAVDAFRALDAPEKEIV